jgi:putative membrane protein insertion efficiency factor
MSEAGHSLFTGLRSLPARGLLALVWLYQRTLSPVLPTIFGPNCGCRFAPTCSHYAAEAVRTHGALAGAWLALRRLLRCTPLSAGGFDPVPPVSASRRLTCTRAGTPVATH